jgi:hypothetical protein
VSFYTGEVLKPAPRPRHRGLWISLAVAVLVLVGTVCGVGRWAYSRATADDISRAHAGDCVGAAHDEDPPYKLMPCGSDKAEFTVLRMLPGDTGAAECHKVPGAALWFTAGKRIACLGKKGVDPKTAVNVAKEGDCLYMEVTAGILRPDKEPLLLDCADPRANVVVLRRKTGVSKFEKPCEDVPGTAGTYGWNWRSEKPVVNVDVTIDVMLCVGPSEGAKAAASASASAQADARSNCKFVTKEELSAVVSGVMGRTLTALSAEERDHECLYQFPGQYQTVRADFTRTTDFRPGTADEVLTVDGLRAIYGPGEGNRVLSVYVPNGNFTVVVWLDGVNDSKAKTIGTAVFRIARPRLPA